MAHRTDAIVITDASQGRSADVDARSRRYLQAMAVRVLCFGLMFVVPGWWKVACLMAAAILPAIGVLLANAQDVRQRSAGPLDTRVEADTLNEDGLIPGEIDDDR